MFYRKLIGFNRHLVKGASQSSSLTHAYNKAQAHTALCKSYKRLKGQNLKMTKIQWTLDKRVLERPRCRQKKQTCWSCEMFCGLLPSIKIKQNKIPHRRTHFIQGCRNQLIFKAYPCFLMRMRLGDALWPHITAYQGKETRTTQHRQESLTHNKAHYSTGFKLRAAIREQGSENMINESRDAEKHTNEMLRRSAAPVWLISRWAFSCDSLL